MFSDLSMRLEERRGLGNVVRSRGGPYLYSAMGQMAYNTKNLVDNDGKDEQRVYLNSIEVSNAAICDSGALWHWVGSDELAATKSYNRYLRF